jgi:SAM-dependent methyltransferase
MERSKVKVTPYNDVEVKVDHTIFEDVERYARQKMPRNPYTRTMSQIIKKYKVKTALDMGCGLGVDTVNMLKLGIDVIAIDGSEKIIPSLLFDKSKFMAIDIRNNIKVKGGVDMIWCREVAEHLNFKYSDTLVRNIVRNCKVVYFTAATPGQIGSGHINCQWHGFWIALFKKYDWKIDTQLVDFNMENHPSGIDRKNGLIFSGDMQPAIRM